MDDCPQVGSGGRHSESFYDDGPCVWCGEISANTRYRTLLANQGLPEPPEGELSYATWRAREDDWFVMVDDRWYWLESRRTSTAGWKPSRHGP